MVESNGVEHPADGRTEEGTRTASIGFTGAWGITAAFAVLLGILGVASWTTNEATKASEWVAHTYQVEENLRKMLSVLQDAETGQRGYLLTGDDAYLEPFVLANDRIDDIVADLRVLTGDNPRQQEAIDRLEPLIADKLDELKQTISLRQAKRAEEALAIVRSDRGKLIMDRIRVLIAEMESVEGALLVVRQRDLEWVTTLNIYGEGIGLIFLIGIAAIVIFKINHTLTFRRRAEADLRKSEARYRTLATVVPVGIFHTDAQGRVTYVNEKWCEIGGMTSEEAMGAGWLAAVHPEDRESVAAKWDAFASNQSAYLAEYRYRRQDGVVAYCYVQALPETDRAGKLIGYVGSVTDITERKRAEEALSTLNEELEQRVEDRTAALLAAQDELVRKERLATLGQLTAMVSHELRNPLGAMRASVAVIKTLASDEPPLLRESAEIADRSITRCDGIISDLLDYTRAQPLDLQATAIDGWMAGILDEYALPDGVAMHRNLRSGAEIRFDRERLRRVLINLLDNACQAMGEGWEGESSITVGTDISGERLRLSVRDTGPGIAPDQLDKVFEPLFSTKSFGIGLGLSIVKQIAEQHGGGIDIDSEPDRGAAFVLWLPLTGKEERAA